jgi:hypothetical protein
MLPPLNLRAQIAQHTHLKLESPVDPEPPCARRRPCEEAPLTHGQEDRSEHGSQIISETISERRALLFTSFLQGSSIQKVKEELKDGR